MRKTALIAGVTGHNGAYLAHHLLELAYRVVSTSCDAEMCVTSRRQRAGVVESSGNDFVKPTLILGYMEAKK